MGFCACPDEPAQADECAAHHDLGGHEFLYCALLPGHDLPHWDDRGVAWEECSCLPASEEDFRRHADAVAVREQELRRPIPPEHNYEYGAQHNGYSHMGIPPECPACSPRRPGVGRVAVRQE